MNKLFGAGLDPPCGASYAVFFNTKYQNAFLNNFNRYAIFFLTVG